VNLPAAERVIFVRPGESGAPGLIQACEARRERGEGGAPGAGAGPHISKACEARRERGAGPHNRFSFLLAKAT